MRIGSENENQTRNVRLRYAKLSGPRLTVQAETIQSHVSEVFTQRILGQFVRGFPLKHGSLGDLLQQSFGNGNILLAAPGGSLSR